MTTMTWARSLSPTFENEQDTAVFWDAHSPEDYPGQFRQATVQFEPALGQAGPNHSTDRGYYLPDLEDRSSDGVERRGGVSGLQGRAGHRRGGRASDAAWQRRSR